MDAQIKLIPLHGVAQNIASHALSVVGNSVFSAVQLHFPENTRIEITRFRTPQSLQDFFFSETFELLIQSS